MSVTVTLYYQRSVTFDRADLSTGCIYSDNGGLRTDEGSFVGLGFTEMLQKLSDTLGHWPGEPLIDVVFQRTDRLGLLPVQLDEATAHLIRTDVGAAVAALSLKDRSPSNAVKREVANRVPIVPAPIAVGDDVLASTFGGQLYFKVRGHELECPCCGFWGVFTTPGLLNNPERSGTSFKTIFVCGKKCGRTRLQVTCNKNWGYVDTEHLLETSACNLFYFPRVWNGSRPWVTRDALQQMYKQYLNEKERALCSMQVQDPKE